MHIVLLLFVITHIIFMAFLRMIFIAFIHTIFAIGAMKKIGDESMIKIIADSTCDLSQELVEKYDITILPLYIHMGDKECKDGVDVVPKEIFEWSDANETTPKTAAPSVGDVMDIMKPFVDKDMDIMIFTISSDMSASCANARLAAKELGWEERTRVIDSENLSTGIGLLIIRAAIMAAEGSTLKGVADEMEKLKPQVRASFVVDTLVYLHRGGRCSATAKFFGTMLKLKPMIVVKNGKMDASKKYRGKIRNVIMEYVEDLRPLMDNACTDRVFITHTVQDDSIVEEVRNYLEKTGIFKEILVTRAGCVVSSHCGPGTLGVLFIEKENS